MNKYPLNYYKFIEEFNKGEYYECHDLLEDIWMVDKKNTFLKGLLQFAVAIYHFENGNISGSRKLFNTSYKYLQDYRPKHWDLNLIPIISFIESALKVLPNENRIPYEQTKLINFPTITLKLEE